jgi:HTH-type transcriptional regulator/antitoxin HigA
MQAPHFKTITSVAQYYEYCNLLEEITSDKMKAREQQDTIELLTTLIERFDKEHDTLFDAGPTE